MRYVVPTFSVQCMLRQTIVVSGKAHPAGTIVKLAYGIALQALAQGVVGAIVNASAAHDEALAYIAKYGADSWFPPTLQTVNHVIQALAEAEVEAEKPEKPETVKH